MAKIRAKQTDPTKWNLGELKTMLRYKMRCQGHSKYKEKDEIMSQYILVANDESDNETEVGIIL